MRVRDSYVCLLTRVSQIVLLVLHTETNWSTLIANEKLGHVDLLYSSQLGVSVHGGLLFVLAGDWCKFSCQLLVQSMAWNKSSQK